MSGINTKIVGRSRWLLRYVWASPCSAVGLAVAVFAFGLGATASLVDGAIEVSGGRTTQVMSLLPGFARFAAITFGHVIIGVDRSAMAQCRAHERVHIGQYERWGILFFILYCGSSILQLLQGRDPYLDNCFERAARVNSAL